MEHSLLSERVCLCEHVHHKVFVCEEQLWSARAVARICGRLQFDIKRDRGHGAHVVARLEHGCQIGVTQFCCRQGKIAEEGAVFQGVEKMAPAYKILPPPPIKPASISPSTFPHVRLSRLPERWKLTHMSADRRAHTHTLSCTNSLLVT